MDVLTLVLLACFVLTVLARSKGRHRGRRYDAALQEALARRSTRPYADVDVSAINAPAGLGSPGADQQERP